MRRALAARIPRLARPVAVLLALLWLAALGLAQAADAPPAAADPALERRLVAITAELRCLVCQNQTIADSSSGLADDLRREVRQQLAAGRTDREIIDFMTQRYGDFVLYRPPVRGSTWLLWFGPALLLVGALAGLVVALRRRARLPAERFDPDASDD